MWRCNRYTVCSGKARDLDIRTQLRFVTFLTCNFPYIYIYVGYSDSLLPFPSPSLSPSRTTSLPSSLLLTLSNPLTTGAPILDGTVPLALRGGGGDGRGLGFIRSLDTRSTLMVTGNLRFELMVGEDCWVRNSLGLLEQRMAVRMAFTATWTRDN